MGVMTVASMKMFPQNSMLSCPFQEARSQVRLARSQHGQVFEHVCVRVCVAGVVSACTLSSTYSNLQITSLVPIDV